MQKLLILFFVSFLSINCLVEVNKDLSLKFSEMETTKVGKKGTAIISFYPEASTDFKDTTRKICFNPKISKANEDYTVKCGLWNSKDNPSYIYLFCEIEETIPAGNYSILLNEGQSFDCGDYKVTLNLDGKQDEIKFEKVDKDIADLYSGPQEIEIQSNLDSYELKFNIVSYHQEKILFNYRMILDCKAEENILKCPLTKKDLLAYVEKEGSIEKTSSINNDDYSENQLYLVAPINIKIKDIPKKDISVNIKKLLVDTNEHDVPIAYETDVTDISNYYVFGGEGNFDLTFINKNEQGTQKESSSSCNFLKYDNNPLYLVCFARVEGDKGTIWMKEITQETEIKDHNIQYDYKIQKVKNEEKINYERSTGSFIMWYYPKELDFKKNSGPISVIYSLEGNKGLDGLTFNEAENDLNCQNIGRKAKKCEVTKEHFKGKKSGLYFLKHKNHLGKKSTNYEIPPINVILEESSKANRITSFAYYSLLLLLIMM